MAAKRGKPTRRPTKDESEQPDPPAADTQESAPTAEI